MLIVLDVMCVYGHLSPVQHSMLGANFLLPVECAVGAGFACMPFILRNAFAHLAGSMVKLLRTSKDLVAVHHDTVRAMADASSKTDPQMLLCKT